MTDPLAAALAASPLDALEELADAILQTAECDVLTGPDVVSVPVRVPSNSGSSVVLGHVAVTSCTVRLDGVDGGALRPGRDLVGAVAAAVCDAEARRRGPRDPEVRALADAVTRARTMADEADGALVAQTRWGGAE